MGLLLASEQVVVAVVLAVLVVIVAVFDGEVMLLATLAGLLVPLVMVVAMLLVDQELQVSHPSADRLDIRQHDQRLPLQNPA